MNRKKKFLIAYFSAAGLAKNVANAADADRVRG